MKDIHSSLGIKTALSTAYHPQMSQVGIFRYFSVLFGQLFSLISSFYYPLGHRL
jgi:hypothetical protein